MRRITATLLLLLPLVLSAAPGMSIAAEFLVTEDEPAQDEAVTHFCDGGCRSTPQLDAATPSLASLTASFVPLTPGCNARFDRLLPNERAGVKRRVERPPSA